MDKDIKIEKNQHLLMMCLYFQRAKRNINLQITEFTNFTRYKTNKSVV